MKRVYNLIGIAQKAGKTSSGAMAAQTSLMRNRACILLMSNDISENTKESLVNNSIKRNIPWLMLGNKYELGACVGKAYRVAVTINDSGMTSAILKALEAEGHEAKSMGVVEWPK